jgi:hypothetical protein
MAFNLRRLRAGEYLTAVGVAAMLVALFVVPWSAAGSGAAVGAPRDGWNALGALRWMLLIVVAVGLGLVVAQARFRAPAIPACLDTVSMALAAIAVVWVIIDVVSGSHQRVGAWLGLAAACTIEAGSFLALRQEGILDADGPQHIPVVALEAERQP